MMELTEISNILVQNGVGVTFGMLMYRMATTSIKENTLAIRELKEMLLRIK